MKPATTRSLALCCALALSLTACEGDGSAPSAESAATPSPSPAPKPSVTPSPAPEETQEPKAPTQPPPPDPSAAVPRKPNRLAERLVENHRALYRAIDAWQGGDAGPRRVSLEALYQQRIFRVLGRDERLAARVLEQLPPGIRASSESNLAAVRALLSLVVPVEPPIRLHPTKPAPPEELLRYYRKGQRQTGIPWQLLASVNFVESRFGRVMGPSTAGALGPMQFLPSTWEQYGGGGDIRDPHDSILAAARYLSASGAPADTRGALFAYNRSYEYVDAIQLYAREMMRDERAFYGYYFWQVFVTTTRGEVQLTGPGSARS